MKRSVLMLDSDLEQHVIRFIADRTGIDPSELRSSSRLLHDLKIDGDDASELLAEYAEAFQVDLSQLDFASYFRSEPNLLVLWFGNVAGFKPLWVADLVHSARVGKWTPNP